MTVLDIGGKTPIHFAPDTPRREGGFRAGSALFSAILTNTALLRHLDKIFDDQWSSAKRTARAPYIYRHLVPGYEPAAIEVLRMSSARARAGEDTRRRRPQRADRPHQGPLLRRQPHPESRRLATNARDFGKSVFQLADNCRLGRLRARQGFTLPADISAAQPTRPRRFAHCARHRPSEIITFSPLSLIQRKQEQPSARRALPKGVTAKDIISPSLANRHARHRPLPLIAAKPSARAGMEGRI